MQTADTVWCTSERRKWTDRFSWATYITEIDSLSVIRRNILQAGYIHYQSAERHFVFVSVYCVKIYKVFLNSSEYFACSFWYSIVLNLYAYNLAIMLINLPFTIYEKGYKLKHTCTCCNPFIWLQFIFFILE